VFDWALADALIQFSQDQEVKLIVAIGAKVPRWPECFIPDWAEVLDPSQRQQAVASFLEKASFRLYITKSKPKGCQCVLIVNIFECRFDLDPHLY
jgi:hypothetical protein